MSNDRVMIYCTGCDHYRIVGKYYPSMPGVIDYPDGIMYFINHHMDSCFSDIKGGDLGNDPLPFSFETEGSLSGIMKKLGLYLFDKTTLHWEREATMEDLPSKGK